MTITCAHCTHVNQDDSEFCENCGAQLPAASEATGHLSDMAIPEGSALLEGAAEARGMNKLVCPNADCKAPLAVGDEFCFNCGTDVRNITKLNAGGSDLEAPTTLVEAAKEIPPTGNPKGAAPQPGQPPVMKDEDIDKALSELDTEVAVPAGSVVNKVGPEAQPAVMPPQQPANPPVANSSGGSIPVHSGPSGGIAANAFGTPPAAPVGTAPAPVGAHSGAVPTALRLHIAGPYGDEVVEWKEREILLGRNDAKTRVFPEVNLDDSAASRRHLSIWKEDVDGFFYIQDLESANGTMLNGQDLKAGEPTPLKNGDVIKIGTRYSIQVRIS